LSYLPSCCFRTGIIFLYAHPQVVNYTCVKFHQHLSIGLGEVALTRNMNRVIPIYFPKQLFAGKGKMNMDITCNSNNHWH